MFYTKTYDCGLMTVEIRLLGSPQAQGPTGSVRFRADKRYQFLAYLAYKNDWVSRDELSTLFWSDTTTETARHNLRQLIKRLKIFSLPQTLEIERDQLRWQVSCDTKTFKEALAQGRLDEAINMYQGDFLLGLESGDTNDFHIWLHSERETLRGKWRETLLQQSQILDPKAAGTLLEKLLAQDPLDEEAVQHYLTLLAKTNQTTKATTIYKTFARHLKDEFGLLPTSTTEQLLITIQPSAESPKTNQAPKTTTAVLDKPTSSTLPAIPALIGRELELSDLAYLLSQEACQLVTITGPGGIGKTSLTVQAAREAASVFTDGVHLVALETVKAVSAVPSKIAEVLLLPADNNPATQVTESLQHKNSLLVLDNLEHLLDSADFIAELITACPKLKILVTSRERLNLEQEQLFTLNGLTLPKATHTLEDALVSASARLFCERAKRVQLHFEVTQVDLPHLVNICQRLGGVPLALELAAVWVRAMSLSDIDKELNRSLDLLESQSRNRVERHRSLRAAFEASWTLLGVKEQEVLASCSVFRGGFSREAASAVTGATLRVLASLMDKSFFRVLPDSRFAFHPMIGEYAAEKLSSQKDASLGQEKHARYFLNVMESLDNFFESDQQKELLQRIQTDWENCLEAWKWLTEQGQTQELLRARATFILYIDEKGLYTQGHHSFAETLESLPAEAQALRSYLLGDGACCLYMLGNFAEAKDWAQQGLDLARQLGDTHAVAKSLNILASLECDTGQKEEAIKHYQECLQLFANNDYGARVILINLAGVEADLKRYLEAEKHYAEALKLSKTHSDTACLTVALNGLGSLYLELQQADKAIDLHQESLRYASEAGLKTTEMYALRYLAEDYSQVDQAVAQDYAQQALGLANQLGVREEQEWLEGLLLQFNLPKV